MTRWLALLLLLASCSGCTLIDEPPEMPSAFGPKPAWLTQGSSGPSSTYFQRPFE